MIADSVRSLLGVFAGESSLAVGGESSQTQTSTETGTESYRVLLAIPYHPSPASGGPNSVAYNTVEGLKRRHDRLEEEDIEVVVLSSKGESVRPRQMSDPEYPQLSYAFYEPVSPHAVTGDVQSVVRQLSLDGPIDLVHAHTLYDAVAGVLLGKESVYTMHGVLWEEKKHVEGPYSRFKFRYKEHELGFLTGRLNRFVAISPYVVDTVERQYDLDGEAFTAIENPISDDFFELADAESEGDLLLCPGVVSPRKNQRALVRGLGRLASEGHDFRAVFTGSIYEQEYYESVLETAEEVGVRERVEFLGNVPREELLDLYARAGVVCLFSVQETAPMTVAEAMASGTPVVASDVGGVEHMIRDGTDGYVVSPDDEAAFADRLGRLLADDELRRHFGENANDEAGRWRCERIADDLIDLYADEKT